MRQMFCWFGVVLLMASVPHSMAVADITLSRIFSDHMVLQRNSEVPLWGTAEPGDELVVTFDGQTVTATADAKGNWRVALKTPDAGGPYEVTVELKTGNTKLVLQDVMIGEVWLCAGQSNMEWPVANALNPTTEIEQSKSVPDIRLFSVAHQPASQRLDEYSTAEPWDRCSPETVGQFSAVAYFFGREIHRELGVPIGLINVSFGGTRAEAWVSRKGLEAEPKLQPLLNHWEENDNPTSKDRPANLYNGMVAPLKGFKFRGAIWYQGEANVGRGHQYASLFPALIRDWRDQLGDGEPFPFYFAQLAPYRYQDHSPEALPEVWEAQLKTMQTMNQVGMVVTTDVGDPKDLHPRNKQAVGRRLALWALANDYRPPADAPESSSAARETPSGPIYESMAIRADQIHLAFKYSSGGLKSADGQSLTHFTICGADGKFVPATVEIQNEVLVVSAPGIEAPKHVRFAWDDTADPNLVGASGLPASPFRTDEFPLLSVGNDF